jgi:hypothetical protein
VIPHLRGDKGWVQAHLSPESGGTAMKRAARACTFYSKLAAH